MLIVGILHTFYITISICYEFSENSVGLLNTFSKMNLNKIYHIN